MNTINKVFCAEVLGNIAFKAGVKRVPCLDAELLNLLAGNEIGEGLPMLEAWTMGWDNANLDVQASELENKEKS